MPPVNIAAQKATKLGPETRRHWTGCASMTVVTRV
jgi:hypothetical protein